MKPRHQWEKVAAAPVPSPPALAVVDSAAGRETRLEELGERVRECRRCRLGKTRTNVVFGSGSASARLMLVGEAPGYHEDQLGLPFVGHAGKLLEKLLGRIGLKREDVFIANVLKCRPPGNRDPQPEEISLCRSFLEEQIDIICPLAVCTLGNFATKLISGKPDGITRVRGKTQPLPGKEDTVLFPMFHPAAALYTPANLKVLERDFDNLGKIIGISPGVEDSQKPQAGIEATHIKNSESQVLLEVNAETPVKPSESQVEPEQLGLF